MSATKGQILPQSLPPRGLNRFEAAAYIGVSASLFDALVKDGVMPRAIRIKARTIWDRMALDQAFEALREEEQQQPNPWDQ